MKAIHPASIATRSLWVFFSALLISVNAQALEFAIFADSSLSDGSGDDANSSFAVGAVDFFASHAIDDKSRAFIEYVFEAGDDGLVTDLERIWVSRDITDNITLGAGRFHAPLGFWNRTYHHGAFMQDTVSRPFFLDFEDGAAGVLAVHTVGLMSWGEFDLGNGTLAYEAALANGSNINTDDFGLTADETGKPEIEINDSGDANSDKSLSVRLRYSAGSTPWNGSVFFNIQDIAESGEGTLSTTTNRIVSNGEDLLEQTLIGFDLQGKMGPISLLTEYYNFDHDSDLLEGGSTGGSAYYLQLAWQASEDLKVLIRREDLSFDENDVWFSLLGAGEGNHDVLALRYELSQTNALKFEINRGSPDEGDSETSGTLQWTFMIP